MGVTNSQNSTTPSFKAALKRIATDYPAIHFEPADEFRWSDLTQTVYYDADAEDALWSLLHETGHMLHGHSGYSSDALLVRKEVEAWNMAKKLAHKYGLTIDEDYVEDCIDSYRYWQHKRSTCPRCTQNGLEVEHGRYQCVNCRANWHVTPNRFCRVYRRREK